MELGAERLAEEAALKRVRATGSTDRDAILDAGSLVEAFVSRSLSALWTVAVSLSLPAAQHDYCACRESLPVKA